MIDERSRSGTRRFARHFERAFYLMHEARVVGELPAVIDVPRVPP
jgi:hypothetical protein